MLVAFLPQVTSPEASISFLHTELVRDREIGGLALPITLFSLCTLSQWAGHCIGYSFDLSRSLCVSYAFAPNET